MLVSSASSRAAVAPAPTDNESTVIQLSNPMRTSSYRRNLPPPVFAPPPPPYAMKKFVEPLLSPCQKAIHVCFWLASLCAWTAFWGEKFGLVEASPRPPFSRASPVFMSRRVPWLVAMTDQAGTTPWASPLEWLIAAMMLCETIDTQYLMAFLLRAAVPSPLVAQMERNVSISDSLRQAPDIVDVHELTKSLSLNERETSNVSVVAPSKSTLVPIQAIERANSETSNARTASVRLLGRNSSLTAPRITEVPHGGATATAATTPPPVMPRTGVFMPPSRVRDPDADFAPSSLRVAMVVTKAPSEPLSVVQKTLLAMLAQTGPSVPPVYDCWLADEDAAPETVAWCSAHGVGITCRKGILEYHQPVWPRRTRCKEGNLAFFYDTIGYACYDVVCQFDADHVPEPSYLSAVLPLFVDPRIGYVACPSICDANKEISWAVRGRLYIESYMHGPLRCSMTGAMPACIGSHYCVRTSALRDIGGIGPELDEDWSTSFMMCAAGWKGAFALDAIAHGDGPVCFEDAMRQEYQWSRSAVLLLPYVWTLGWWLPLMGILERLNVIYFFAFWPRSALYLGLVFVCALGPAWGITPAATGAAPYIVFASLPYIVSAAHWLWVRSLGHLRPHDAHLISYEAIIHRLCAPIWMAYGVAHGTLGVLFKLKFDIKVTPKGPGGAKPLPLTLLGPVLALALAGGISLLVSPSPAGNYMTAVYAYIYWLAGMTIMILHWRENGFGDASFRQRMWMVGPSCIAIFMTGFAVILGSIRLSSSTTTW